MYICRGLAINLVKTFLLINTYLVEYFISGIANYKRVFFCHTTYAQFDWDIL